MNSEFTSCDWGTTNLRVRIVRGNAVIKELRTEHAIIWQAHGRGVGGTPQMALKALRAGREHEKIAPPIALAA